MKSDYCSELTYQQLKTREVSESYLIVEENTQFLSQLIRYDRRNKRTPFKLSVLVEPKSIIKVIVEISYLLYGCLLRNMNILLSQLQVRPVKYTSTTDTIQQVFCQYMLQLDFNQYKKDQQQIILSNLHLIDLNRSSQTYGFYIGNFVIRIRELFKSHFQFIKKNQQNSCVARQLLGLGSIIDNYILPKLQQIPPKTIILLFEQSEVFRETSLLVKCLNSSIFSAIRFSVNSQQIYTRLVHLESNLKINRRKQISQLTLKIQRSIEQSFLFLLKQNILSSQVSYEDSNDLGKSKSTNQNEYILGKVEQILQMRRYKAKVFVKEKPFYKFNDKVMMNIIKLNSNPLENYLDKNKQNKSQQKVKKRQFLIEYESNKNTISIRLVTNLELNVEASDSLLYHFNYVLQNWRDITLDFIEKLSESKKKEKYLTFKIIAHVIPQQMVIFKILVMIDTVMMIYKILEPQLLKNIDDFDTCQLTYKELSCKCDHMKRVYLDKIQRSYRSIQQDILREDL